LDWTTAVIYDKMSDSAVTRSLRAGVSPMTSPGRSTLTVIIVVALASFALVAAQVSRASAQSQAAQDREVKAKAQEAAQAAREAAARAQEAAQAAREAAVKAQAAVRPAAARGEPVTLDLSKYLVMKPEHFEKSKQYPWAVTPTGKQTFAGVPL